MGSVGIRRIGSRSATTSTRRTARSCAERSQPREKVRRRYSAGNSGGDKSQRTENNISARTTFGSSLRPPLFLLALGAPARWRLLCLFRRFQPSFPLDSAAAAAAAAACNAQVTARYSALFTTAASAENEHNKRARTVLTAPLSESDESAFHRCRKRPPGRTHETRPFRSTIQLRKQPST